MGDPLDNATCQILKRQPLLSRRKCLFSFRCKLTSVKHHARKIRFKFHEIRLSDLEDVIQKSSLYSINIYIYITHSIGSILTLEW